MLLGWLRQVSRELIELDTNRHRSQKRFDHGPPICGIRKM